MGKPNGGRASRRSFAANSRRTPSVQENSLGSDSHLDFSRCQRPDGTYYGTGGVCRSGVPADKTNDEKVKRVKRALSSSFDDFISEFGENRQKLFDQGALDLAQISSEKLTNLPFDKMETALVANQMLSLHKNFEEMKGSLSEKEMMKLAKSGDFFTGMKWRMLNPQFGVTPGTLALAWKLEDTQSNAKTTLKGVLPYGSRRLVVPEHVVPTKVMVSNFLQAKFSSPSQILEFAAKRNIMSMTSAPEDYKIEKRGFKSSMPAGNKNPFARYDGAQVKMFPVSREFSATTSKNLHRAIDASVKKAKAEGLTYEEWVATVVDL